ncbi:MAG: hypothetical protein ACJ78Q_19880 [Chloroflexia bacterium]
MGTNADLPSSTIIGANITGANTATYPGGVVAPAAELAGEEADAEGDLGALNLDALDRLGNKPESQNVQGSDAGVSSDQSELEADELNG